MWNANVLYIRNKYYRHLSLSETNLSFKTTVLSVTPPLFDIFRLNCKSFKLKMKLALLFLSILVVISHGQFHLQWEGHNWRTPYFRQHVFRNYHPVYYDYLHERVPPLHQFSPINRVAHMVPILYLQYAIFTSFFKI